MNGRIVFKWHYVLAGKTHQSTAAVVMKLELPLHQGNCYCSYNTVPGHSGPAHVPIVLMHSLCLRSNVTACY